MKINNLLILVIICFITACQGDSEGKEEQKAEQKYLLAVAYDNNAWGTSHAGIFVDIQGNFYHYYHNKGKNDGYLSVDDVAEQSEIELTKVMGGAGTLLETIDIEVVKGIQSIASEVTSQYFTELQKRCSDAGSIRFLSFKFNNETELYTPYLLERRGGGAEVNLSPAAKELVDWLEEKSKDYQLGLDSDDCSYIPED
ncbi:MULTISPECIES: hypothetical protein [unclassified Colwellia]|uniref:hypothetical protein n=1 Tax=unclassified Colwellia TaxID=196834 RepID=UPI0015F3B9AD|nr:MULTISPECIES: hypothetical protein [unclassified Colwellia]MBA6378268.1 hypothetical protein [Colwellia sp. BRX10-7]MBA6385473.1 hypothetical protein [Colwellia sp. BRX10-2]MBA6403053.1 hypothetical protein [Colwellia sp. BRX10-5]MBA6407089.1 hypothetical protein [Colwellia sp. BRX10-1]